MPDHFLKLCITMLMSHVRYFSILPLITVSIHCITGTPTDACENKMNGDYEAGENLNDFHSCSNGLCTKMYCPGSLVFSTVCGDCLAKYYSNNLITIVKCLTHFSPMSYFNNPWKSQTKIGFLGGIEMWHWTKMS